MDNLKNLDPADAKSALKAMDRDQKAAYASPWTGKTGISGWIEDLSRFTSANTATAAVSSGGGGDGGQCRVIIDRAGKRKFEVQSEAGVNLFRLLADNNVNISEREVSVIKPDMTSTMASNSTALSAGTFRVQVSQKVEGGC